MARKLRAAAQAAAASIRTPIPDIKGDSDEEMADVDAVPQSQVSTPQEDREEDAEEDEQDEVTSIAPESEAQSQPATPAPVPPVQPRRKRLGRPPKNKPPDWDLPDDNQPVATPVKRRRGRPPASGRWAKRGGPSHVTQVPIDKEGNMMPVIDDEVALPEDPEGEAKVDKLGNLKGGREYRVRTFKILNKGDRLYMLSTEPARCIGFRDSYLFFQKHKQLFKIIIGDDEKRDLIERELIPHSYKGRAIGVVTARSVFREFGAKIIIGGKKVIDDYQEATAKANGEVEGELAVPDDKLPGPGETYDRNRYVAWHGASAVYHSGAPSVPMPNGKIMDSKKRKVVVTGVNWMLEHARAASRWNSALTEERRKAANGTYDPHTNSVHYPKIMQPTHARFELVSPSHSVHQSTNKSMNSNDAYIFENGIQQSDTNDPSINEAEHTHTIFPPVAPIHARNFIVEDTVYESPPVSHLGIPGPDGDMVDIGFNGISNIEDDIVAELPPECRKAFEEAKQQELHWKGKWQTEHENGLRTNTKIPYTYIAK
ncbi:MAG: hypothetical protein M1834_002276 [Cirrosporium novae-zelandiae]|nr:MAG: hypothetical protein M1834_002276 [Cirrosporium novae-zelandiae]